MQMHTGKTPYLLTPWSTVLLERLTGSELVMNSRHFTEPEGSLPHSQVPATCPYPETGQSSPCPPSHFLKIHLNIILTSKPVPSKWSLLHRFLHQNPVYTSPLLHMCYMPRTSHSFYLITWTILGEEYRSLSSSFCSYVHSRYLIPLRPKHSPQHPILKHPQSTFLPQCGQSSVIPI